MLTFFLTAVWLPHGQLWAIIEGIVCIGVSTPLKNTTPSFLLSPPLPHLNLQTVQAPPPPFLGNPPYILFVCEAPL